MTEFVLNPFTSPSFNLALEQYLLTEFRQNDVIMLWRNSRSVIVGKNQNVYREIDLNYVSENKIPVIRRLTGGGTVFHDLGNINYTFISDFKSGQLEDFKSFAAPVCAFLQSLGVNAEFSGRNDITVNGKKVSGTAQTVKDGRCLFHGTLLYDADLSGLSKALRPNIKKLEDKAVRSIKSRVCNIKEACGTPFSVEQFFEKLSGFFLKLPDVEAYELKKEDILMVEQIQSERYERWDWNFGFSPEFSLKCEKKFSFGLVELSLEVSDGKIAKISVTGDYFGTRGTEELENRLKSVEFSRLGLERALCQFPVSECINGMNPSDLVNLILSAENSKKED